MSHLWFWAAVDQSAVLVWAIKQANANQRNAEKTWKTHVGSTLRCWEEYTSDDYTENAGQLGWIEVGLCLYHKLTTPEFGTVPRVEFHYSPWTKGTAPRRKQTKVWYHRTKKLVGFKWKVRQSDSTHLPHWKHGSLHPWRVAILYRASRIDLQEAPRFSVESTPDVLIPLICLPHWTLIKASCCVCRIGPAIGQGEVVPCEDVRLLIGSLVIWYIQNVLLCAMRQESEPQNSL